MTMKIFRPDVEIFTIRNIQGTLDGNQVYPTIANFGTQYFVTAILDGSNILAQIS